MRDLLKRFIPYASLIILFLLLSLSSPYFLTVGNLSVGSLIGLTGVAGTMMISGGFPAESAVLGAVLVGAACGLANGTAVTALRIPPFIATLGALGIYRGLSLILTNGIPVVDLPRSFGVLATGDVAGVIPVPLVIMLFVALLIHSILKYTRLGRYAYAIGSNPEAARCCGIRIGRCTIMIYAVCGALTGLAGMIEAARVVTGQPTAGEGYELRVIAAVVIGGGSLNGGQGTVIGTIVGSFIMGLLNNGCNLLGISPFVQQVIIGAVIVLAVTFDEYQRRRMG